MIQTFSHYALILQVHGVSEKKLLFSCIALRNINQSE